MSNELIFNLILTIVGGVGLFLFGMRNLSDGLQAVAGNRLRKLIGMATNNRFAATGAGTLVTCIIQSSTITTMMTVGFVNSGLMTLHQAIGVIMGANIGTTLTGWILAIDIGKYGLPILGAAALVLVFSKREKIRYTAMTVMGVGMVFFGLELMKNGFAPIRDVPEYLAWFQRFSADTYFGVLKCALVGCIVTMIVQSSSATLGITMGLAASGVIGFETAAALVLGENVGTTFTAYIASLGTNANGKRAAYTHILFNISGAAWITAIFPVYIGAIRAIIGNDPNTVVMVGGVETYPFVMAAIAAVHTGFSVANTLLFLPFTRIIARQLTKLIPDKPQQKTPKYTRLDRRMLESPMMGIAQSRHEITRMSECDRDMFAMLKTILSSQEVDESLVKDVFKKEEALDGMQMEITVFLTEMLAGQVPPTLGEDAQKQLRLADEFETVSDYVTSQMKLYLRICNAGIAVPDIMREELLTLHGAVSTFFDSVNLAYREKDTSIIKDAYQHGDDITNMVRELRGKHLARLAETPVDPLLSTTYPSMLAGYRRAKEHMVNIAEVMVGKGGYAGKLPPS
ncbi:MAG: Na/Pi cotransporter family protein [Chitinispirillales bacterium]|jgi:phosphate:Na+ symporter|nr:Na/Pi cotransporter family protein [Chitinispirillales bacterium]